MERVLGPIPGFAAVPIGGFALVNYYAQARDSSLLDVEADDVMQVAIPFALSRHLNTVVVQQTIPVGGRATGVVRGYLIRYDITPERLWRRVSPE